MLKKSTLLLTANKINLALHESQKQILALGKELHAHAKNNDLERFMFQKRRILDEIICSLPLGNRHCPFCAEFLDVYTKCKECPYKKAHGWCIYKAKISHKKLPDYVAVIHAREALRRAILNYWRGDERI